jgi:putative DNA primase/helicase
MNGETTAIRLRLVELGYEPTADKGKAAAVSGWQSVRVTDAEVRRWAAVYPQATNTGIRTKLSPAIDIDVLDEGVAGKLERMALDVIGDDTLRRVGLAPKRLLLFRADVPFRKASTPDFMCGDVKHSVEVLADGQKFTAFGIHPDTRREYSWNSDPLGMPRSYLPILTAAQADTIVTEAARMMSAAGWIAKGSGTRAEGYASGGSAPRSPLACLTECVGAIPNNDETWGDWARVGLAIYDASGGSDEGFAVFDAWSRNSSKYREQETRHKWLGFHRSPPNRVGAGTLVHLAKLHGWEPPPLPEAERKPWSAAGYFIKRCAPRRAWRIFKSWCQTDAVPPIAEEQAWQIFRTVMQRDLS